MSGGRTKNTVLHRPGSHKCSMEIFPTAPGFRDADGGNEGSMPTWTLLSIPGTFLLLAALLFLTGVAEARVVSPRALILRAVTARRTSPEIAERLVVAEVERLLRSGSADLDR